MAEIVIEMWVVTQSKSRGVRTTNILPAGRDRDLSVLEGKKRDRRTILRGELDIQTSSRQENIKISPGTKTFEDRGTPKGKEILSFDCRQVYNLDRGPNEL